MTSLTVHRRELLAQLELEAAMGWPAPYWPADQATSTGRVLGDYLDRLIAAIGVGDLR